MNTPDTNPMADLRHQLRALIARATPDSISEGQICDALGTLGPDPKQVALEEGGPNSCPNLLRQARDAVVSVIDAPGTDHHHKSMARLVRNRVEDALDLAERIESEEAQG